MLEKLDNFFKHYFLVLYFSLSFSFDNTFVKSVSKTYFLGKSNIKNAF